MARVTILPGLSQVKSWEDLRRFTSMVIEAIASEVNGKLDIGQNLRTSGPHSVTFASASDVQALPHTLNRVPQGIMVINLNSAIVVYQPASPAWSANTIYLQASGAGTATLYVV